MTQATSSTIPSPPTLDRAPLVERVAVRGFKSVRDAEIEIAPINLLIGGSGSGKSNFIGAFEFLRTLRSGRLQNTVRKYGGADKLLHFGSKITPEMSFGIWFRQGENLSDGYEVTLAADSRDSLYVSEEVAHIRNESGGAMPYIPGRPPDGREASISEPNPALNSVWFNPAVETETGTPKHVARGLDGFRLYHFHDTGFHSPMKKTTEVRLDRHLLPDGSNLAAFLYRLREEYQRSYNLIKFVIGLVAPFFQDFHLEPRGKDGKFIILEWLHANSDAVWDAASLSDGTLRFMALAALLLQPKELMAPTILLDGPEQGLHPDAVSLLADMVYQATAYSRVILATQSQRLVNEFKPEHVIVANRVNGATELCRLNADDLAEWLSHYRLGDLWEMNEFGGNPTREAAL